MRGPFPFRYPEKGIWNPREHQRFGEQEVRIKGEERCVDKKYKWIL